MTTTAASTGDLSAHHCSPEVKPKSVDATGRLLHGGNLQATNQERTRGSIPLRRTNGDIWGVLGCWCELAGGWAGFHVNGGSG